MLPGRETFILKSVTKYCRIIIKSEHIPFNITKKHAVLFGICCSMISVLLSNKRLSKAEA